MSFSKCKELIEEGDTVILYIGVSQIYALEVKPKLINKAGQPVDNVFQTRYGSLKVMDLIGEKFGSKVNLSKGWARVLYPTPELWTVTLPHRTQILYTPDISMVVMQLEIGPGSVVCEAGTGSGSVSHALLRTIGPTGKLYTCDFHKERAQVSRACELMASIGLQEITTLECLAREFQVKYISLPVISKDTQGAKHHQKNVIQEELIKSNKKRKIDLESPEEAEMGEDDCKRENNAEVTFTQEIPSDNIGQQKSNDFQFKTGVTQLKMPGHTGFLTFATVPPGLKKTSLFPKTLCQEDSV
nr:tRNA (adenine(58)-N(1))-methyltransferase catalytic subunit TRMT61A-like isoform X2 [Cherax quadricarinatus]